MNKEDNLKEKFKQALISTVKVISDDHKLEKNINKNLSSKNYNFFELDNLNTTEDYIKLRAETDSEALKRKFSNKDIYQKNLPKNSHCKTLYKDQKK
jgi:Cobalamin biosynthesis protein CobT.